MDHRKRVRVPKGDFRLGAANDQPHMSPNPLPEDYAPEAVVVVTKPGQFKPYVAPAKKVVKTVYPETKPETYPAPKKPFESPFWSKK